MKVLLDTNILTRSVEPGGPMYQPATEAVVALRTQGHQLCLVPQNLYGDPLANGQRTTLS